MKYFHIQALILEYKNVYENAGIEPPPYRLTCKEHKELIEYLRPLPKNHEPCMIKKYYGIDLEVVMIVEEYL